MTFQYSLDPLLRCQVHRTESHNQNGHCEAEYRMSTDEPTNPVQGWNITVKTSKHIIRWVCHQPQLHVYPPHTDSHMITPTADRDRKI